MFGGIHQSAPSLKRAGVSAGDMVVPVRVLKGEFYVIACAIIREFITLADYAVRVGVAREAVEGLAEFQIKDAIARIASPRGHRAPYGCGTEVALVDRSTPIRFDVRVPVDSLKNICFCPRRGGRSVLGPIVGGRLKSSAGLQGHVRRLCPESRDLLADLIGLGDLTVSSPITMNA
jgi:hypothetical protein